MAEEAAARLVEPVHDSTAMAPLAGTHGGAYHSSSRRSSSVNSATAPGHPRRPSKRGWRWQVRQTISSLPFYLRMAYCSVP